MISEIVRCRVAMAKKVRVKTEQVAAGHKKRASVVKAKREEARWSRCVPFGIPHISGSRFMSTSVQLCR